MILDELIPYMFVVLLAPPIVKLVYYIPVVKIYNFMTTKVTKFFKEG